MANDDKNKRDGYIKNPELFKDRKETSFQQIIDRGAEGVRKEGQSRADYIMEQRNKNNSKERPEMEKEAMSEEKIGKGLQKKDDKPIDHKQDHKELQQHADISKNQNKRDIARPDLEIEAVNNDKDKNVQKQAYKQIDNKQHDHDRDNG